MRTPQEQSAAIRTTWVSVLVNVVLVTLQILVGVIARSQALIADGLHSASDIVADLVVLFAARHGNAAADADHPYGHARFETFASLVLGLILIATGAGMAAVAAQKLQGGVALSPVHPLALVIAVVTLVAKEVLFRYMRRVGEQLHSSMLVANAWHARADAASSLVVAVGIAANLAGMLSMDAIAAAIVGFMVAKSGLGFTWASFRDLTDHSLSPEEMREIERTILATEGVRGTHEMRTRRMGDWALVDLHVLVDSRVTVSEGHYIAERVRAAVLAQHRVLEVTVHIDPAEANDIEVLVTRPTRGEIMTTLRRTIPEATLANHVHRLHYLDDGVEIEVQLAPDTDASERGKLVEALDTLVHERPDHLVRVKVIRTV